jgi:predicted ferric reductase
MPTFSIDFQVLLNWLLGLDSGHVWWYITRSAGVMAYLLLWLSTAWGLAVSSKIFDPLLHRQHTYDFHQFISLLALGFTALHFGVLLFDNYLPFSVSQVLVPFTAPTMTFWVGIGGVAWYLSLLVTVTFYARRKIGMHAFRWIHTFSLVAFAGAAMHGIYSGTDSPLAAMTLMYEFTTLSVIFLTAYWLINLILGKRGAVAGSSLSKTRA